MGRAGGLSAKLMYNDTPGALDIKKSSFYLIA